MRGGEEHSGRGKKRKSTSLSPSVVPDSDPMDCSLPGSSVHGILQVRRLEWVAIPFSKGSSWPRDQTHVTYTAGRFCTVWATREAQTARQRLWGNNQCGVCSESESLWPRYRQCPLLVHRDRDSQTPLLQIACPPRRITPSKRQITIVPANLHKGQRGQHSSWSVGFDPTCVLRSKEWRG